MRETVDPPTVLYSKREGLKMVIAQCNSRIASYHVAKEKLALCKGNVFVLLQAECMLPGERLPTSEDPIFRRDAFGLWLLFSYKQYRAADQRRRAMKALQDVEKQLSGSIGAEI